jgi:hypothetical protein
MLPGCRIRTWKQYMALIDPFKGQSSVSALRLKVRAEAFQGFADVQGMLVFDGGSLRIDFQTADALLGVLRSGPKQLEVPLGSIEAVRSGAGWFWLMPWIEIEINDFKLMTQLPGAADGSWRLGVRWRDRQALRRFASALAFARSGDLHQRLTVGLDAATAAATSGATAPPPLPASQSNRQRQSED